MVLYYLKLMDIGVGHLWQPNWRTVCEKGADEGLVRDYNGFPLLAPPGPGQCPDDI